MRCISCHRPAVIEVRRHHSALCRDCFVRSFRGQVERAIRHFDMIGPGDRVLVAVSGGKDSLALWDVLLELGIDATGLSLGLGIGKYSARSTEATRSFARDRGAELLEGGFDVVATGHNLDDEAATLLGNTLRWKNEYMARQSPRLPAADRMVRKVKPLYRLSELETAAYAFLRGIDYVVEECPLVVGNTQLRYKEAMNEIERTSPGTKTQFFLGFLDRGAALFAAEDGAVVVACERCEQPTTGRFCAFRRARAQILGERLDPPDDLEVNRELADEVLPVEIYDRAGA